MAPNSSPIIARQNGYNIHSVRRDSVDDERNDDGPSRLGDPFWKLCFSIALYLTNARTGKRNIRCGYGEKMDRLTRDMLLKHKITFKGMTERLQLNEQNIVNSFEATIRETFADGCNFGRIVATYAFFVAILDYCLQHNMEGKISQLQNATANVVTEQKEWINRNGGWSGFMEHFTDTSEKIWKGFMVATVGLGALASFLYARS